MKRGKSKTQSGIDVIIIVVNDSELVCNSAVSKINFMLDMVLGRN